nr:hypothetical protein Y39B6B.y [imported] - Caenorhabditis elegans [Caenorhabditis elegans]
MQNTNYISCFLIFFSHLLLIKCGTGSIAYSAKIYLSNVCKNFQKCLDGPRPLLDENLSIFSCQRGCPDTFFCENQLCCPNTTAISSLNRPAAAGKPNLGSRSTKAVEFQLESSTELERTLPCERYPYKLSCKNDTSQPIAKWYFDIQTLSCELYPFGQCEDDPLDKLALRTRGECEERCDVAKVKAAIAGNSKFQINSVSSENIEREAPVAPPTDPQIAIDDVIQESKHIRGRPFAIEPPTDLVHVIHVKSDRFPAKNLEKSIYTQEIQEKSENLAEIDENLLLTSTMEDGATVPTVTSNILEILEDALEEGSGSLESLEKSGNSGEKLEENRKNRRKSVKSLEHSFEQFYQRNKESVSCSATAYRLLCSSGASSQFVYRWEKVGGVCQSFPYGYCLKEQNVAHPRTREECEQFCD